MTGIPVITHVNSVGSTDTPNAVLLTDEVAIIGGKGGLFTVSDPYLKSSKKQVQLLKSAIRSIVPFGDGYSVLSYEGKVMILDAQFDEVESLPFKSITHQSSYDNRLSVSTKNQIFIYQWIKGETDMVSQYKLSDKVVKFEMVNGNQIVWSNGSSFYQYSVANEDSIQLEFNSKYSLFNQFINITVLEDQILISRGKEAALVQNTKVVRTFTWENPPQSDIIIKHPFLILNTGNYICIKELRQLKTLQKLNIISIESISVHDDQLLLASNTAIQIFDFNNFVTIVKSITDVNLAIELVEQLSYGQYNEKFNKLRDLNVQLGLQLFANENYKLAFNKFIEFVAPPFQIIHLFPTEITGFPNGSSDSKSKHPPTTLLTHYITDQRRKLSKLIAAKADSLSYNEGKISIDFFTEGKYSVGEILELLDTTLFNLYIESNPGLIGSLVRVDNHLNEQTVIEQLTKKHMINELIDFYFKRDLHEKALNQLNDIYRDTGVASLLVRYLQRMNNDNIDLILKFAKDLVERDVSNGEKVFIDSVNSTELNEFKIQKFLKGISMSLEMKYLEFVIIESKKWGVSKVLNFRLLEIYLVYFSDAEFDKESQFYPKIYNFLQEASFNFDEVMKKINDLNEPNSKPLLIFKTLILFRFDKHEEALRIFIFQLNDPESCVEYLSKLQHTHSQFDDNSSFLSKYKSVFLKTIGFLQETNNQKIMLELLSSRNLIENIPLSEIFKILSKDKFTAFKVQELQGLLISNINETTKSNKYVQLTKNLKYLVSIRLQSELLDLNKFKIVENETQCSICHKQFSNSGVIYCVPKDYNPSNGDTKAYPQLISKLNDIENRFLLRDAKALKYKPVHLGCLDTLKKNKEAQSTSNRKLKTIRLIDYESLK